MFYLILAILLACYYLFAASHTVKATIRLIAVVGSLAVLGFLLVMAVIALFRASVEVYVGLVMLLVGVWALRDMLKMPLKK